MFKLVIEDDIGCDSADPFKNIYKKRSLDRVTDSSTGEHHFLSVPDEMKTCREAIAWTFHMKSFEYHPLKET